MERAALVIAVAVLLVILFVAGVALHLHDSNEACGPCSGAREPLYGRGVRSGPFVYPYDVRTRSYSYYLNPATGRPEYQRYARSRGLTGGRPPAIDFHLWPAAALAPH